ncbi:exonuclease domain-containing protein [Streptosporangium sp. NPDC050855]|uniref:3'-5' exonuclease n=1 Tax=Streptosporangium sp. NPDC050855 TaxID=3366194 RepID=UPI00378ABC9A
MSTDQTTTTTKAARRRTAHTATQLQEAMGISADQLARARAAELVPPPDMKTPRWSGPVVDDLVARRQEILGSLPDDLDEAQLREALGMSWGDWKRAREAGVLPAPDRGEFWTRALADELIGRAEQLRAATPPQPLGARRSAEVLAELTGLAVAAADIEDLAERGLTSVVGDYKGWELYDVAALHALAADEQHLAVLADLVGVRTAWLADSLEPREAAAFLGWKEADLTRVVAERTITPGRFGRFGRADLAALAQDEDLMESVRGEQLLGPDQAAVHLEMRRTDLDYIVAAGWVRPAAYATREVGVRKSVEVPLYRVADLEAVLTDVPGVDWEAVRAVKSGEPSPLREHTRLPATRAAAVHAFCTQLGDTYSVEVWPRWWNAGDTWTIDWELNEDGHPTKAEVAAALAAHHGARPYADQITLSTAVGRVIRWARTCQQPGEAVVLDTETTGLHGVIVEICVLDACNGRVLLDTLVRPEGVGVEPGARAVHGITDAELADAPTWQQVLPDLLAAIGDRRILAYNADFDRRAVAATHANAGLDPAVLPGGDRWECLMEALSTWYRIGRWLPLDGGHRARADALAALNVLRTLGAPCQDGQRA